MKISRRALGLSALATTALGQAPREAKATFILVPGAWHGAWCWRMVERALRKAGHEVYAVTLTGLADRAHLLTREVKLSTHIEDVTRLMEVEVLNNVVLVGHSYAGMVVTGVAARLGSRLRRLVYLDAFVPSPGQSAFDLMNPRFVESWRERTKKEGDGWRIPPLLTAAQMGLTDAREAARVDALLTAHPLATFEDRLAFDARDWASLKKAYVLCKAYPGFAPTADRVKKLGVEVRELDSGHDAMLIAAEALADTLKSLV